MSRLFRPQPVLPQSAELMTPEERRFAEVVLGKVVRTERETLEWVAQFSDRHVAELRVTAEAEANAQRGQLPRRPAGRRLVTPWHNR